MLQQLMNSVKSHFR